MEEQKTGGSQRRQASVPISFPFTCAVCISSRWCPNPKFVSEQAENAGELPNRGANSG
jgi:hypothetical protein